eukprot:1206043-Amphidinium_carterae.1
MYYSPCGFFCAAPVRREPAEQLRTFIQCFLSRIWFAFRQYVDLISVGYDGSVPDAAQRPCPDAGDQQHEQKCYAPLPKYVSVMESVAISNMIFYSTDK